MPAIPENISFIDFYQKIQCLQIYRLDDQFFTEVSEVYNDCLKPFNVGGNKNALASQKLLEVLQKHMVPTEVIEKLFASLSQTLAPSSQPQAGRSLKFVAADALLQEWKLKENRYNSKKVDVQKLIDEPWDGLPLSTEQQTYIDNTFRDEKEEKEKYIKADYIAKAGTTLPYDVLRLNNRNFMVYPDAIQGGTFGEIKIMKALDDGKCYVVKEADFKRAAMKNGLDISQIDTAVREEGANFKANHENESAMLVQLNEGLGSFTLNDATGLAEKVFIGEQYIAGISADKLQGRSLPPIRLLNYITSITQQIIASHQQKILHRDIKLKNIQIDAKTDSAKLLDWGFAVQCQGGKLEYESATVVGSMIYMAPEIFDTKIYDEKTDVYAWGCSIAEWLGVVFEKKVLGNDGKNWYFELITDIAKIENPVLPKELLAKIIPYLQRMMHANPKQRPALSEVYAFYDALKDDCLHFLGKLKKVGIVNVEEIKSVNVDGSICINEVFLRSLRLCDQVVLYNPKKDHDIASFVSSVINQYGIPIIGKIDVEQASNDQSICIEDIAAIADKIEEFGSYQDINSFVCVTGNPKIVDAEALKAKGIAVVNVRLRAEEEKIKTAAPPILNDDSKISILQYQVLTKGLFAERERLRVKRNKFDPESSENKILLTRLSCISHCKEELSVLYQRGELTHKILHAKLENLQKEMLHTSVLSTVQNSLANFHPVFKTKGAKAIADMESAVKKIIVKPPKA